MCVNTGDTVMCMHMLFLSSEPPSMPINVEVTGRAVTSVILSWGAPLDLGGRDDTQYKLCYEAEADGIMQECIVVASTTGTITGKLHVVSLHVVSLHGMYCSVCMSVCVQDC